MSNQFKQLKQSLYEPDGLNVFFVVIVVAFGLMLYELGMFYYVITPKIKNQISDSIKDIGKSIKTMIPELNVDKPMVPNIYLDKVMQLLARSNNIDKTMVSDISLDKVMPLLSTSKNQIDNILEIMDEREELLTSKINNYTKVTGLCILLGLAVILLLIYSKLKSQSSHIEKKTLYLCLYTFVLIMGFQFFFYYYGQNFFYSSGKELNKYLLVQL